MTEAVRDYFDRIHDDFDSIYRADKNPWRRFVDRYLRTSVDARYRYVLRLHGEKRFSRVLDVGCGTGRYGIALARRGAKETVGVDFAPAMVEDAKRLAREAGVADACRFEVRDFLRDPPDGRFDLVLAMGVFDYVDEPVPLLSGMAKHGGLVVGSFPVRYHPLTPVRKARLAAHGVPVRFYTKGEIERAFVSACLPAPRIVRLARDYVAFSGAATSRVER
ncbi:MAG: class I SAM-dependent methyltransferase [Methanobacteriota archaeon]